MKESETIKQEFNRQLETSIALSGELHAELRELQHCSDRDYCTLDQSRVLDSCVKLLVNTMSAFEKLNEKRITKINEGRN